MAWKINAASVIGKHHIDKNVPCQDDFSFCRLGDILVGAVCDGAGSSSHSEVGARECSRSVVESIVAALKAETTGNAERFCSADFLESVVEKARNRMQAVADDAGFNFLDLSCTLVGCVVSTKGGCFFHIGDGFAVAETDNAAPVLSLPENGEYANETYFVTATEWKNRLRITRIPPFEKGRITLMSDGAASFVINREKTGLFAPFIDPVSKYLSGVAQDEGDLALRDTLADERTFEITGDDKTLMIAVYQ